MRCHLCGTPLGITAAALGDTDFCCKDHRTRFQARLKKGLELLTSDLCDAAHLAPAIIDFVPADLSLELTERIEPVFPIRLDFASLSIAGPLIDEQTAECALPESEAPPAQRPVRPSIPADPCGKLARIADLRSRLGKLRRQLDNATEPRQSLATI